MHAFSLHKTRICDQHITTMIKKDLLFCFNNKLEFIAIQFMVMENIAPHLLQPEIPTLVTKRKIKRDKKHKDERKFSNTNFKWNAHNQPALGIYSLGDF